jgi:CRP/FNR family transcriptional regulator, anaerobic regulatory protein
LLDKEFLLAPLLQMLHGFKPMRIELEEELIKSFSPELIAKDSLILREGDVCKNLCVLADGILRMFHNIADKEITSRIMLKGHMAMSPGSFFTQTKSIESIEAVTESIVLRITFEQLQNIYDTFPEFNYHTRQIIEMYFYNQEQRLYMLRQQDAMAKYTYFIDHYGDIMQHIPQKFIASYLNITPETLSRIRKKLSQGH